MAKRGQRNQALRKRRESRAQAITLPAIDALTDLPTFADLRLDDAQRVAFEEFLATSENAEEMHLGFVVRLDRGYPLVATASDVFRAEHAVSFAKQDAEKDDGLLPAVGDCVAVRRAPGHDMGVIERVLPRRTSFERWRGRSRGEKQVLAANVDTILIVQALGAGDVLLDRYVMAMSFSEISEKRGRSVSSVRRALDDALDWIDGGPGIDALVATASKAA